MADGNCLVKLHYCVYTPGAMLKKYPKTLKIFFATEVWERYGFYVVQTLLALYLVLKFHLADHITYEIVGSFTALTYISPILGGFLS